MFVMSLILRDLKHSSDTKNSTKAKIGPNVQLFVMGRNEVKLGPFLREIKIQTREASSESVGAGKLVSHHYTVSRKP